MTDIKYQQFVASSAIQGANARWIEDYYEQFLEDPESVDESWRAYFRRVRGGDGATEIAHGTLRLDRLFRFGGSAGA